MPDRMTDFATLESSGQSLLPEQLRSVSLYSWLDSFRNER